MFVTINMQSARADSPSTPKGVSDALWQAYQEVAFNIPSNFKYQDYNGVLGNAPAGISSAHYPLFDQSYRNIKWSSPPNVMTGIGLTYLDEKGLKSAIEDIGQTCLEMKPKLISPTLTLTTFTSTSTSRRTGITTSTTTTIKGVNPNSEIIYFEYLHPSFIPKIFPWVISLKESTDSLFSYGLSSYGTFLHSGDGIYHGNLVSTQTLISNIGTTQKQRDLIAKRALLDAIGLQGTTANKDSKAFISDPNWDGTLSSFDRQLINLQCNSKVPSYATVQQVADALNS